MGNQISIRRTIGEKKSYEHSAELSPMKQNETLTFRNPNKEITQQLE